jgi:hypothetical protein
MATWQLRPAEHPDLSDSLVHFTGRARPAAPQVPQWIRDQTPDQRLESILRSAAFVPSVSYSGGWPAVCFTESTVAGLEYLIERQGFHPWGLMIDRQWVFDQGGAPVWHYRSEDEAEIRELSPRLRTWAVRLDSDPSRPSDWLFEREWRVPCKPDVEALVIDPDAVHAVIVGDPFWAPEDIEQAAGVPVDVYGQEVFDLGDAVAEMPVHWTEPPACWSGKPRLCWTTGPDSPGLVDLPPYS